MQIFETVIDQRIYSALPEISRNFESFYLGGGTAIALQIGHRISEDLDFFTDHQFDEDRLTKEILGFQSLRQYRGTVHGLLNNVRLSFLYYPVPLIEAPVFWNGIKIAAISDLVGEKFKTVSQRGAKKDFCDLYAIFHTTLTIQQGCQKFRQRFQSTGLQFYSILKSLCYFEDAESDPDPIWLKPTFLTRWEDIKSFFIRHLKEFEKELLY